MSKKTVTVCDRCDADLAGESYLQLTAKAPRKKLDEDPQDSINRFFTSALIFSTTTNADSKSTTLDFCYSCARLIAEVAVIQGWIPDDSERVSPDGTSGDVA